MEGCDHVRRMTELLSATPQPHVGASATAGMFQAECVAHFYLYGLLYRAQAVLYSGLGPWAFSSIRKKCALTPKILL
jgi:hypothetical protein